MTSRFTGRGAVVAAVWTLLNAFLAGLLFIFTAHDDILERSFYWASVGILVITTSLLLFVPRRPARSAPVPGAGQSANGAPATAFAAACLIGGLAWVFGVVLAYLALPLIAFVLARWRVEWAERRQERRS